MTFVKGIRSVVIGLGCMVATPAQAVVITQLTGFGDFTSPTIFTQDFETAPFDTPQMTFDPTVTQASAADFTSGITSSGDFVAIEAEADEPLSVLFSDDVFEVGFVFGNDDFFLVFDVILDVFDGSDTLIGTVSETSNANDFADQFLGLRSDTAISRVEISYSRPAAFTLSVAIDDFTIGTNGAVSVPEPATLSLLAVGALALGASAYRRRRRN